MKHEWPVAKFEMASLGEFTVTRMDFTKKAEVAIKPNPNFQPGGEAYEYAQRLLKSAAPAKNNVHDSVCIDHLFGDLEDLPVKAKRNIFQELRERDTYQRWAKELLGEFRPECQAQPDFPEEVQMDRDGKYVALCCGCDEFKPIECDPMDFDPNMHYCGGSERCCP